MRTQSSTELVDGKTCPNLSIIKSNADYQCEIEEVIAFSEPNCRNWCGIKKLAE